MANPRTEVHTNSRVFIGHVLLAGVIAVIAGCASDRDNPAHHIKLGDWTSETNIFGAYLAADSIPFSEGEPPLLIQPDYIAETVFYGLVLSNVDDPHGSRHLVRDQDSLGADLFYFDANNNENLTDDGLPLPWTIDSSDSMVGINLDFTLTGGRAWIARLLGGGLDERASQSVGRPVLTYGIVTNTARRGWWVPRGDSIPVEFFAPCPPGATSMSHENWFVFIDVNRDGQFQTFLPDILVSTSVPEFEFDSTTWRLEVDSLARTITMIEGENPKSTAMPIAAVADSMAFQKYMTPLGIKLAAPAFADYDLDSVYLSLDSLHGRLVVLNFWTTSCVPCRGEMPALNDLVKRYRDRVEFISFTLDSRAGVPRFLEHYPFEYHVVPAAQSVFLAYGVNGFPVHVLIDRDGYVRFSQLGASVDIDSRVEGWIRAML